MEIWALTDDRIGNINQVLGVAEALKLPFEIKKITYDKWVKLPNFLRGATLRGIDNNSIKQIDVSAEKLPDLVIGAGRRIFPLMLYLNKKSKGKTKIVQLMNPGSFGFKKADLIVLPLHDQYKGNANNVMQTLGAPHRITKERLQDEFEHWKPVFEKYPAPIISVIVGGATKKAPFTDEMARSLASCVLAMEPASLLITTSRRTPQSVIEILQRMFPKDKTFFYKFGDKGENPYFGLLAWGSKIIVTGDSMSMCSEACAAGVPVYIFAPDGTMGKKHALFHQQLYKSGYATPLGSGTTAFGGRLNAAEEVALKIKSMFNLECEKED